METCRQVRVITTVANIESDYDDYPVTTHIALGLSFDKVQWSKLQSLADRLQVFSETIELAVFCELDFDVAIGNVPNPGYRVETISEPEWRKKQGDALFSALIPVLCGSGYMKIKAYGENNDGLEFVLETDEFSISDIGKLAEELL